MLGGLHHLGFESVRAGQYPELRLDELDAEPRRWNARSGPDRLEVIPVSCPFCGIDRETNRGEKVLLMNDRCLFVEVRDLVLVGSGIIVPRAHRETVFDLTLDEWTATFALLR
jgi:hypothetical protein